MIKSKHSQNKQAFLNEAKEEVAKSIQQLPQKVKGKIEISVGNRIINFEGIIGIDKKTPQSEEVKEKLAQKNIKTIPEDDILANMNLADIPPPIPNSVPSDNLNFTMMDLIKNKKKAAIKSHARKKMNTIISRDNDDTPA